MLGLFQQNPNKSKISKTYAYGYTKAVAAVNSNMVETSWKIGQYIVEFEQGGSFKATYGKALLENLAKDLTRLHGKGFSRFEKQRNLRRL